MADVSVVIPVADYHTGLLERAVQSCNAQTVPVEVIVIHDTDRRGAGWARNRGLEQVSTPFVVFLDADDELLPTFVERCAKAIRLGRYVYTDWLEKETRHDAPSCAWVKGTWHVNTTLLFTEDVRKIGGYDEALIAGEDTELYVHLTRSGICGKRLAEPLFRYGAEGRRSAAFIHSPERQVFNQLLTNRYGDIPMASACGGCGGNDQLPDVPPNGEMQPGDVLVSTLWQGTRSERGRMTGRLYKGGWGAQAWVSPKDVEAMPHLFKPVETDEPAQDNDDFEALAAFARDRMGGLKAPTSKPRIIQALPADAKADVNKVLKLYGQTH